ncbi:MAG: hypothetical protein HYY06_02075 [Deltaproteobacteria bacterium]|nr:hypothetical protein [Deltaproteobacteria bacterium]
MLEPIRLVTIHPALVHFTLGALPIMVLAYAMGLWRRSDRWTFAGDVATVSAAAITLGTFAFGLVSNAVVEWPGGLDLWRYLHLALGALSTAMLGGFALLRLKLRFRSQLSGRGTLGWAIATSVVVLATGWIGGEVLVFHSGVAVKAAADGALAPPTTRVGRPSDLLESMGQLRASWAAVHTRVARMIAERPRTEDFEVVATEAGRMERLARWIGEEGPRTLEGAARPSHHEPHGDDEAGEHEEGREPPPDPPGEDAEMTRGEHLTLVAEILEGRAAVLRREARKRDLPALTLAAGRIDQLCVGCHEEIRWDAGERVAQRSRRRDTVLSTKSSSGQP